MTGMNYWQSQSVELRVVFLGVDGLPLAAGGVAFRVKKPDGTLVSACMTGGSSAPGDGAVGVQDTTDMRFKSKRRTQPSLQPM